MNENIHKPDYVIPFKTVVCSPQVLQSVTDESLVRTCQRGEVAIQNSATTECMRPERATVESTPPERASAESTPVHGVISTVVSPSRAERVVSSFDAAQLELCRRYQPLIRKFATLSTFMHVRDDVESFLWLVFLESIYSYDASGDVPFAGYAKSAIHYGQLNYFKRMSHTWSHEVTLPMWGDGEDGDGPTTLAMDQFGDDRTVESTLLDGEEERRLRHKLWRACQSLSPDQRELLRQIYLEHTSLTTLAAMGHTTKQAIQQRHQRALQRLRYYMGNL